MPDRTMVVDSLAPKRDIGAMAEYGLRKVATAWLGVSMVRVRTSLPIAIPARSAADGCWRVRCRAWPSARTGRGTSPTAPATASKPRTRVSVFSLRTEYVGQHRDQETGDDHGWYALGAYQVNRLIQLVARYEEFERASAPAPQTLSAWGAGTNLFFAGGGRAKLMLDYLSRKSRMPAATTGLLLSQLQVRF
jgi:hypothetical protein